MDESSFELLRRQTDQHRREFIETDIETAMTFLQLARTERELGDHQHASRLLFHAQHAYNTIAKFLAVVGDPTEQQRLSEKFEALGSAIKEVQVLQGKTTP